MHVQARPIRHRQVVVEGMSHEDLERDVAADGSSAGDGEATSASVAIAVDGTVPVVDRGERGREARPPERFLDGDGATRATRSAEALVRLEANQIDRRGGTNRGSLPERPFSILIGEVGRGGQ